MSQLVCNSRNSDVLCRVILFGTYVMIAAAAAIVWANFGIGYHAQASIGFIVCAIVLLYTIVAHMLLRRDHHYIVAYMILVLYTLLATGAVWTWGVNAPLGILIFGLVIVVAGILLNARCAFIAAIVAGLVVAGIQMSAIFGWHTPDVSWASRELGFTNVLVYCIAFCLLALVSLLYGQEAERSKSKTTEAESALSSQKVAFELRAEKRTARLCQAQLKEMQQMYRFAELGQVGITLLHDLANHLTALTLEIDDLHASKRHAKTITRAKRITTYLTDVVEDTRERLHGSNQKTTFNIAQKIGEALAFSRYKAEKVGVVIDWKPQPGSWKCVGDPDSLGQVVAILTSNAIDASSAQKDTSRPNAHHVSIAMDQDVSDTVIRIGDWGKGIAQKTRKSLFKPFHSTKRSGMGLGLYIAKQTVEMQFGGTLEIDPRSDHTEFVITLPRVHRG